MGMIIEFKRVNFEMVSMESDEEKRWKPKWRTRREGASDRIKVGSTLRLFLDLFFFGQRLYI